MKPYLLDQMVNERQAHIQQQADKIRLASLSQVYRLEFGSRILAKIGGWMVTQGTHLQSRYEAASAGLKHPDNQAAEVLFS